MVNDIFDGLNESQKEAVRETEGRVRVVAGAGAGKTKTLATRYAFLVNCLGIDPSNILCLTFTNKAAREMSGRIATMVDKGNYNDFVCTIHGFCVKFLRREIHRIGFPKSFAVLDTEDQKQMASEIMDYLGIDRRDMTVKDFIGQIADRKSHDAYIDLYMTPQSPRINPETERDKFKLYIERQMKLFALDFDDLLHFTLYILHTFDDVRKYWQDEMSYIMVDEAQDCNQNDWKLIETLGASYGNIFIVGDPDQAIYEWRGSMPGYFVDYNADKTIILNENYRSTPGILDAANSVIKNNRNRIDKDLYTKIEPGAIIVHHHAKNETAECEWVANEIKKGIESGRNATNFAILYRTQHSSRGFEQALLNIGIPYEIWGGVRFFERKEVKDAISYLRIIENGDDMSFKRICNVPSRKIGKSTIAAIEQIAKESNCSLLQALEYNVSSDKRFSKQPISDFVSLIEECRILKHSMSVSDLLEYVMEKSGLKKMYREDGDEDRLQNLSELINSVKFYEDRNREEPKTLTEYLQDIALYTNADYKDEKETVKLMTIHQAKGLEFPYVFVVGLSEGLMPSLRSIRERKEAAEEEERRLMYVAITRAKERLYLTESEGFLQSTGQHKCPSRFLVEIKKELFVTDGEMNPQLWEETRKFSVGASCITKAQRKSEGFEVGSKVSHEVFGTGEVVEVNKERETCRVQFKIGIRNIIQSYLSLMEETESDMLS